MHFSRVVLANIYAVAIIILLAVLFIFYSNNWSIINRYHRDDEHYNEIHVRKLLLPNNKNIFFVETSCAFEETSSVPGGLHLTARQACAIFSTANLNPTRPVILYHSCPLHHDVYEKSTDYNKHLLKLPNFYLIQDKYEDLLKGTIVENIICELKKSSFPIQHDADVLRLVLLHKYGGAYMDLDFISIKSLDSLPQNLLAPESSNGMSNGFFQFDYNGKGNLLLKFMLSDLSEHYSRSLWNENGPALFKRAFCKFCNATEDIPLVNLPKNMSCEIKLSQEATFYPVHYGKWKTLFNPKTIEAVKMYINNSIAVHFWNFLSKDEVVFIGENSPYEYLAKQYCKDVLLSIQHTF